MDKLLLTKMCFENMMDKLVVTKTHLTNMMDKMLVTELCFEKMMDKLLVTEKGFENMKCVFENIMDQFTGSRNMFCNISMLTPIKPVTRLFYFL